MKLPAKSKNTYSLLRLIWIWFKSHFHKNIWVGFIRSNLCGERGPYVEWLNPTLTCQTCFLKFQKTTYTTYVDGSFRLLRFLFSFFSATEVRFSASLNFYFHSMTYIISTKTVLNSHFTIEFWRDAMYNFYGYVVYVLVQKATRSKHQRRARPHSVIYPTED